MAIAGVTTLVPCHMFSASHLEIGHPQMELRVPGRSSDALQWLSLTVGHQNRSLSGARQADLPNYKDPYTVKSLI